MPWNDVYGLLVMIAVILTIVAALIARELALLLGSGFLPAMGKSLQHVLKRLYS